MTDTYTDTLFRGHVVRILSKGRVPGPAELARLMGWANTRNINGRATRIRTEELVRHGYVKDWATDRWVKR